MKNLEWLEKLLRYPWEEPLKSTTPMEGIYRKSYQHDGKKIMVFVLKDDPHSEIKYYIDGNPVYTVSFNSFEDLLNGLEKAEYDFRRGFLENFLDDRNKPVVEDKLKSFGFE
jgi:hypothetical protein